MYKRVREREREGVGIKRGKSRISKIIALLCLPPEKQEFPGDALKDKVRKGTMKQLFLN